MFSMSTRIYADNSLQVLAILYKGHKAAQEEPRLLGTVENQVFALSWAYVCCMRLMAFVARHQRMADVARS